jgi:transcriptional regulator with GAF, ATPase, and Fis domain
MSRTSLFRLNLLEFERRYLLSELTRHHWNRAKTARELGLSYRSLQYKIIRHHLSPPCETSTADGGPGPGRDSLNVSAS